MGNPQYKKVAGIGFFFFFSLLGIVFSFNAFSSWCLKL
jgi:hypothetical protein